jgi:UDP-N-acetylglucosamine pyrophosphorylase
MARQILHLRQGRSDGQPAFYLMNSFATQQDSLAYLQRYPQLGQQGQLDFLQSKVPKISPESLLPVSWAPDPELEWCPPGHGDLYPSLAGSGLMDRLLERGVKYLFVSNSDNLGATVDLKLVSYFARSNLSFLMEVAERTEADMKGGHVARNRENGRLLLRESAQCPPEDIAAFQDIAQHRFFNTNNLWIRLDRLKAELDRQEGALPLPLIRNSKTVDPKKSDSPKVLQLESAMGAAIECFDQSGIIVVPRTRFAPVKTNGDLLALRSDAYTTTEDFRFVLDRARRGQPPVVELDKGHYQRLSDFDRFFAEGIPSLKACEQLRIQGPVLFASGIVLRGKVEVVNSSSEPKKLSPGVYNNQRVEL